MNRLLNGQLDHYEHRPDFGVNFVNWFQVHSDQERVAMEICSEMKVQIIPAFVQLARTYRDLFDKQNRTLTENELIFDYTKLADTNALLGRLLDEFQTNYANTAIRPNPLIDLRGSALSGLLARPDFKSKKWMKIFNLCELTACKLLYSMIAFLDQNRFISANISLREHNETADYFFHRSLERFLKENYRQVNYLLLKEKYRCLLRRPIKRLVKLTIRLAGYLSFASALFYRLMVNTISELLFNLFRKELKQVNRNLDFGSCTFGHSGEATRDANRDGHGNRDDHGNRSDPEKRDDRGNRDDQVKSAQTKNPLGRLDSPKEQPNGNQLAGDNLDADSWPKAHSFKSESNLKTENRCYLVVDQAHLLVAEFCVQSLRAITGTLFHFWVIKEPLSDSDIDVLKDYRNVLNGIQDDVYAALHKYLLSTRLKLRPYGFIMNSALLDNLPTERWCRSIRNEMRPWLQESISIFLNWNFEFHTVYPRPMQAQYGQMRSVSSLYQSMIESLIDFKVVLVLARQLNRQIAQCFYEGKKAAAREPGEPNEPKFVHKSNLQPASQLPWTLIEHLESNFVCRDVRTVKQSANNRVLPSTLINQDERTAQTVGAKSATGKIGTYKV